MENIGIICAMNEEANFLLQIGKVYNKKNTAGVDYLQCEIHGKNVIIARSGIGKVNAAISANVMCREFFADCIVNIGVAGALNQDLDILDIVVSTDVVQHDFNAMIFGYEPGIIPQMNKSFFSANENLVNSALKACMQVVPDKRIVKGRIASGDVFVADDCSKNNIRQLFGADCVEMEGAAIGQACYLNGVPFVVIRVISDKASNQAKDHFESFIMLAAKQSADIVERMIRLF